VDGNKKQTIVYHQWFAGKIALFVLMVIFFAVNVILNMIIADIWSLSAS
jgi:hypothetical protein